MRRVIESVTGLCAKRERGQMLVIFAAIFFVTLGLAAFAVDQGMWLAKRRSAQKDADAAARGGVYALLSNPADPEAAVEAAGRLVADQNGVPDNANTTFTYSPDCQTAVRGVWSPSPSLHVEINDPTGSLFGRVLGIDGMQDLGAEATACLSSLTIATGVRPWAMPHVGESLAGGGCSAGSRLLDGDCVSNCFEKDADGAIVPSFGSECRIRSDEPQSVGSISLEATDPNGSCNGNSGSAADYKENIIEGSPADCAIGDIVSTKQGLATGPTLTGLKTLIASEGACDARYDDPAFTDRPGIDDFFEVFSPADAIPGPDTTYAANECDDDPSDLDGEPDSPRFVTVVVVYQLPLDNGTQDLTIINFAGFFIEKCEKLDNKGDYVPSTPLEEAKCDLPGSAAQFQIVGRFVQYIQLGGDGGAVVPGAPKVILLVE